MNVLDAFGKKEHLEKLSDYLRWTYEQLRNNQRYIKENDFVVHNLIRSLEVSMVKTEKEISELNEELKNININ